jgi:hypothetical protein
MPKQMIHEGSPYHLIPMKNPDGSYGPKNWERGFADLSEKPEGTTNWQDPSVLLTWSKRSGGTANVNEPGDEGFVQVEVEATVDWWLELLGNLQEWKRQAEEGKNPVSPLPHRYQVNVGPLTWKDLNVLVKTAREARDDAFGKPE